MALPFGTNYVDGMMHVTLDTALRSGEGYNAFKGLIFTNDHIRKIADDSKYYDSNDQGISYLDNLYVSQYSAYNCKNDNLKITVDNLGEVTKKGSKLNIGFSEWLNTVPIKSNIVIKDSEGKEFTDFTVSADNAQATITFTGNLKSGVYTVSITGVQGAITGSEATNTAEFVAASATEAVNTEYIYAEEDFEALESGVVLPNWYYGDKAYGDKKTYGDMNTVVKDTYNRYFMGEVSANYATNVSVATGADGTKAMQLSGDKENNLYYFFPRGVVPEMLPHKSDCSSAEFSTTLHLCGSKFK
ncbi:MAG: hypothetical protein U0M60_16765 [Clostridia bacterium]|nr:hypothetical protein [Clostridia bacterium]